MHGVIKGKKYNHMVSPSIPAFLLSNHLFHFCSTLSAGIHFLPPQKAGKSPGGKNKSCPKIISMEITLVTVFKPLVRPHL